ncbi:bifunctional 4-hydroxy-2-oxoglutarate aldolase/2-dehydro-3-deoxy-phosphogluconate aldolase [Photobacterium damselae subsp. damselae]|uniref:bifunctional 4-hydroxy-2-oxoglutarate aldolase/2-dehydro-3-deoxy-phosphogluconate aldolase n=1 Tax=Photobacterium damselae TaxID=38293 RepID=UPI000A2FB809|nr:bifunctional 4-hydroxy-2-oxoglutarate aldolase/2-dehydro-3-deoxy-phosphogluconate aldolase [Photobacterium damselae]ARR48560.1 keto-deoxy-phosphogluconate aldolase [Photobacterium damselae subsp. damselae]QAY34398.1 bifunctional 4-hydroxy-2-oxoglutarate aldolase/2-dehydro-3-deoxy-phosphogluconate aldolase [Photobacterium damselae subsp. damselae]QOQ68118.1 bifunctional 4-hydroxy-2-oxoglutarate aldolase/2-dehydro-3-deoxy-phosphogluconate aldolase [Photobacterium damselae subsp. damselae]
MNNNWTIAPQDVFAISPIIPVMVIERLEDAIPMAKALMEGGISIFEITLRTPVALEAMTLIANELPQALVGAGTVLTCAQYDAAVQAGAKFAISPGMSPTLLLHAQQGTVPLIPGVATPSEIMQALDLGYDHLKFFPAEAYGGAQTLKAISAPLPQVTFCPTGGINTANVIEYKMVKSVATIGGSWMLPKDLIAQGQWEEITKLTKEAVTLLSN